MNIHRFRIMNYLHVYFQMKDNCLHFNLVSHLLIYLEDWLRYIHFTIARQIKSIFNKNRAFSETSMKFGM